MRWATRLRRGVVQIAGRTEGCTLPGGVGLAAGDVELAFTFEGGAAPRVVELALLGGLTVGERQGTALDADPGGTLLDGVALDGPIRMDLLAQTLVLGLSDVSARAEVVPDGELLVKFQHGVQAVVSSEAVLTVEGAASGPPSQLRLAAPLVLTLDGGGVRLSHQRFHRLASLASVRIERASLHPDGEVRLHGGAHAAFDRVVQGGLDRASARLSELVRRSPRFARLRSFLVRRH